MLWCYELLEAIRAGPQLVNDSKTPSGRVHVGALRGVLIHDTMYRVLRERGVPARYTFGSDDYDPLDELPAGHHDLFREHLGRPLCEVPAPPGSTASDFAEHFIGELFEIFRELGVGAETYRMRDVYRTGRFNDAIAAILDRAGVVREVYREVSGARRPDDWLPLQAVCEHCGRIGTTRVFAWDGREVEYVCEPRLVRWAEGCGGRGRVSPFDGRAKLPWKLEWTAKWHVFGVTIEGAGKDHTTRGGSREVSAACLRRIFGEEPPLNIPYEWFLVGGAKMSSSRGVGAAARDIADLLTPEALRFLFVRARPKKPVDFRTDEAQIARVYNELDRYHARAFEPDADADERAIYRLAEVTPEEDYFPASFPLILTLLQMPHREADFVEAEIEKRKGAPLTATERRHLERRIAAAQVWLERYASPEERIAVQETLPARARELDVVQRAFLHRLAAALRETPWQEDALQAAVFDCARRTPLEQPRAFQALYRVLLDRSSGPKAGSLLEFLDRDLVLRRLVELPFSTTELWEVTALEAAPLDDWLAKNAARARSAQARVLAGDGTAVLELAITHADGKTHVRRRRLAADGGDAAALGAETAACVDELAARHGIAIRLEPAERAGPR